ncbi:hypothetical protein BGZ98_008554 [Dissophora globulifera]|nr:hypothetical protein BGZ98_008554 [Dissophora globulifera]
MSRDNASPPSSSTSPTSSPSAFSFGPGIGSFSSAPASTNPSSTSSPPSRRSSGVSGLGDRFGRLGGGLPTVEENELHAPAERHPMHTFPSSSSLTSLHSNGSSSSPVSASSSATSSAAPGTQPRSNPVAIGTGGPLSSSVSSPTSSFGTTPPPAGSAKRSHTRSMSMKEQLAQFGQDGNKEGAPKALQSLQDMISSLKNLPANSHPGQQTTSGASGVGGTGFGTDQQQQPSQASSRHEKRLSMSSIPSRSSMGQFGVASNLTSKEPAFSSTSTTTTLHISQPPRGTSIENALQSTVATLRRLSVSDPKRPSIPGAKKDDENASITESAAARKVGSRRSVVLPQDIAGLASSGSSGDHQDVGRRNRRSVIGSVDGASFHPLTDAAVPSSTSATGPAYQSNRRSVIIRPEEVAALQEGRPYVPSAAANAARATFDSDEESDAIADTLSALEGKGAVGNRSSISVVAPHRRSVSSIDPNSLAEFAAKLPGHMSSSAFQNLGQSLRDPDASASQNRWRYTTAFNFSTPNRSSMAASGTSSTASRRLSALPTSKDIDRKDWRMSTPALSSGGVSNRDSINFKDSANGRRPLFQAHLTYSDFHSLLTKQKHKYVQGVLRINKRNRSDAYVTVDSLPEGDVYICGSKDRNRALEGDVVGIELIEFEDMPVQKLEGGKEKKKNKRVEDVEEAGDADVEDIKPKYCGRVVSIVERSLVQMFSGTLTLQRPSGSAKKNERRRQDDEDQKGQPRIVWFKPTDKRVPLIAIPIDQAPDDFVENHAAYAHKLFIATIKRWPLSSLHPFGHLERELGDIGNIEIETEALLADNNITTTPFGEKVEKCLPELPWAIPEKELSRRRDLRQCCTFTIDPATARDLDDAVSCIQLDDGTFEVGVHIADVSHFIKAGSALDREAKARAATVYLVQKAIPMLPTVLSEDLCSLTVNSERLTFSVFWKMTESGDILDTSFTKSVIRSCAQLSFDDAQKVITNGTLDPKVQVFDHPRSVVEENIKTFFKLSSSLRKKRFENGALSLNPVKLSFETDEKDAPVDVSVYELKESNRLIEEFMLLANMSVAKQICEFFPEQTLLRRHEEPLERRMADFIEHMNRIGLELDASSAGALQTSLDAIQDPEVRKVVRLLAIKPMHRAKYICGGMLPASKHHHYAMNAPLYTHFTSPIRRYADILVHRLLEASLTGGELPADMTGLVGYVEP